MKLCCPISGFIGMTCATGFVKENEVLWIDPPEEKAEVFLNNNEWQNRGSTQ